jgi:hypothetical protein
VRRKDEKLRSYSALRLLRFVSENVMKFTFGVSVEEYFQGARNIERAVCAC